MANVLGNDIVKRGKVEDMVDAHSNANIDKSITAQVAAPLKSKVFKYANGYNSSIIIFTVPKNTRRFPTGKIRVLFFRQMSHSAKNPKHKLVRRYVSSES